MDPLITALKKDFVELTTKATVYGESLDWNSILNLKKDLHGKWQNINPLSIGSLFTEVVWEPRGTEIHFKCEEVPLSDENQQRGGRYFHSILNPKTKHFIHIDGAIRFYSDEELIIRERQHVRNAGKIGKRIKVFKVNGEIPIDIWAKLVKSFFFWNEDVFDYISTGENFPKEDL